MVFGAHTLLHTPSDRPRHRQASTAPIRLLGNPVPAVSGITSLETDNILFHVFYDTHLYLSFFLFRRFLKPFSNTKFRMLLFFFYDFRIVHDSAPYKTQSIPLF